jgi:hypothetical protein
VEGEYTEDATLEIIAMGQPPCESRETARSVLLFFCFELMDDRQLSGQYMATLTSWVEEQHLCWKTFVNILVYGVCL